MKDRSKLTINPAVSEAQRKLLYAKFGADWVHEHHFDNAGKLPPRVAKGKKKLKRTDNRARGVSPLKHDPTRTAALRRLMSQHLKRRFDAMKAQVVKWAQTNLAIELPAIPTPAQAEAGNYRKGHVLVQGLDVSIETAAGVKRKPHHDKPLAAHYGYIKRTEGADGDHVDVFLGPNLDSTRVWVIDQYKENYHGEDEAEQRGSHSVGAPSVLLEPQGADVAPHEGAVRHDAAREFGEHERLAGFGSQEAAVKNSNPHHDDHGRFSSGDMTHEEFAKAKAEQQRSWQTVDDPLPPGVEEESDEFFDWLADKSGNQWTNALARHVEMSGPVNAPLRSGEPLEPHLAKDVEMLDKAFAHKASRLTRDTVLYRALAAGQSGDESFTDKGYPSTAYTRKGAETFGNDVIAIHAPKGTKAIYGNPSEKEIILPRNTRFVKQPDGRFLVSNASVVVENSNPDQDRDIETGRFISGPISVPSSVKSVLRAGVQSEAKEAYKSIGLTGKLAFTGSLSQRRSGNDADLLYRPTAADGDWREVRSKMFHLAFRVSSGNEEGATTADHGFKTDVFWKIPPAWKEDPVIVRQLAKAYGARVKDIRQSHYLIESNDGRSGYWKKPVHEGHVTINARVFDEHKCLIGFTSETEAVKAYRDSYPDDWNGIGRVREMSMGEFKAWLAEGPTRNVCTILDWVLDVRQRDHYSCGAAAWAAVAGGYRVHRTLSEWKRELGTDVEESTRPQAIVDVAKKHGFQVEARDGLSIDDIAEYINRGWPVICPVQDYGPEVPKGARFEYGHYVVAIGRVPVYLVCQDSSEDNVIAGEGSVQAPGRVLIADDVWDAIHHDEDVDGNKYVRFGIAIGPPSVANAFCPGEGARDNSCSSRGSDAVSKHLDVSMSREEWEQGREWGKRFVERNIGSAYRNSAPGSPAFTRSVADSLEQMSPREQLQLDRALHFAGPGYEFVREQDHPNWRHFLEDTRVKGAIRDALKPGAQLSAADKDAYVAHLERGRSTHVEHLKSATPDAAAWDKLWMGVYDGWIRELKKHPTTNLYNPDQPRDEHGRFGSGGIERAKSLLKATKGRIDAMLESPRARHVKAALEFSKKTVKTLKDKLEGRYGKAAAIAIMASGQATGWGITGMGAAFGVPLWIPGSSIWGVLPGVAVAEAVLQGRKLLAKGVHNVDTAAAAKEFLAELQEEYHRWLEEHREPIANAFCPGEGARDNSCSAISFHVAHDSAKDFRASFSVGEHDYEVSLQGNGESVDVSFERIGHGFSLSGDMGASALAVFRTVGAVVDRYIGKYAPREVYFSADKGESARVPLYDKAAKLLAKRHGYELERGENRSVVGYTLRRIDSATRNVALEPWDVVWNLDTDAAIIEAVRSATQKGRTGPDYQRLFWDPEAAEAWWVSADGDERHDVRAILDAIRDVPGVAKVTEGDERSPKDSRFRELQWRKPISNASSWVTTDRLEVREDGAVRSKLLVNFDFQEDPTRVESFKQWLRKQLDVSFLSDEELWQRYIERGYRQGVGRSFDDARASLRAASTTQRQVDYLEGSREEFLRSSFAQPMAQEKVEHLAGRAFTDLRNVTEDMGVRLQRVLSDGLVRGDSPHDVAKDLAAAVDFTRARAETIARTELIRAHSEGQLDSLTALGAASVGVAVEWSATEGACELCSDMDGVVYSIADARGLIPRHPNCRCAFVPSLEKPTANRFCPTGVGGGKNNSCGAGAKASAAEARAARTLATRKIVDAPVPTQAQVEKARAEMERVRREGATNPNLHRGGTNIGGSAEDRRRQRRNLFREFGGEEKGYVVCPWTGIKMHWTDDPNENPHGYPKFERGKIFVKCQGGGYQLPNLIPESFTANRARNDKRLRQENSDGC